MSWIGALYIVVMLVVFAELYSMRGQIKDLCDEIEKLNETYRRKVIEQIDKQLHEDDEQ